MGSSRRASSIVARSILAVSPSNTKVGLWIECSNEKGFGQKAANSAKHDRQDHGRYADGRVIQKISEIETVYRAEAAGTALRKFLLGGEYDNKNILSRERKATLAR